MPPSGRLILRRPAVRSVTAGLCAFAVLALCAWVGYVRMGPPDDVLDALAGWDAQAVADVQAIAREPRPRGSEAHAAAREYLVGQLRAAGWLVSTPSAESPRYFQRTGIRLEVINIIATLPGREPGPSLMLMAHYDSRRGAPGAGDDASGVAAVLHAARQLAQQPDRRNEVVIVLTDGEEEGLVGALALLEQQIEPETIGAVLNFEGRGSWGPVVMFESEGNERELINHYAAAVQRPVTSSLAADLYRIMPNATDFTVSSRLGVPGLNFAFVGGWMHYHQPTDNVENLDRATLRHHLQHAESLALRLADADLTTLRENEPMVFFDVLSVFVVRYPAWYAPGLAIALGAVLLAVLAWGIVRGALGLWRIVLGGLAGLSAVVLAIVLSWGAVTLLPGREMMRWESLAVIGLLLLVLTAMSTVEAALRRRVHAVELSAGTLGVTALLALASAIWLRGGSYIPLLSMSVGLPGLALMIAADREVHRRRTWVLVVGAAAIAVLVLTPEVYLVHLATVPNVVPPWNPRIPTAPFAVALSAIVAMGMMPVVRVLACGKRWPLPIASAIFAAACLLIATQPWAA